MKKNQGDVLRLPAPTREQLARYVQTMRLRDFSYIDKVSAVKKAGLFPLCSKLAGLLETTPEAVITYIVGLARDGSVLHKELAKQELQYREAQERFYKMREKDVSKVLHLVLLKDVTVADAVKAIERLQEKYKIKEV